jgi:predicted metal-binding protein
MEIRIESEDGFSISTAMTMWTATSLRKKADVLDEGSAGGAIPRRMTVEGADTDMEKNYQPLLDKAMALGATGAKLIRTDQVVFDPRSFLKCRFGCNRWGKYWTCPPNLGISPREFREAFERYGTAVVIRSSDPKVGQDVTLAIEKEAMILGCSYAFAMALCVQCETCAYPEPCEHPHLARPSMDAYGVDIGQTVEAVGFKVEFDADGKFIPAWYSMVLID